MVLMSISATDVMQCTRLGAENVGEGFGVRTSLAHHISFPAYCICKKIRLDSGRFAVQSEDHRSLPVMEWSLRWPRVIDASIASQDAMFASGTYLREHLAR